METRLAASLILLAAACATDPGPWPSDDPADWPVDSTKEWHPHVSEPRFVVPSPSLPARLAPLAANNNVSLARGAGRLWMAWRTAPFHFASPEARLEVVSSPDLGKTWSQEATVALGTDQREPLLLAFEQRLSLFFFEAGTDMLAFEPHRQWRRPLVPSGELEQWGEPGEITWDMKVRGGKVWRTSYAGSHYALQGESRLEVRFSRSSDGVDFKPVRPDGGPVYSGGVSEVSFEFDDHGDLWAVTRNEDGDSTGFGSHLCRAPAGDLGSWTCPRHSSPDRYDSPRMFRHGHQIYLLARRDVGGPYDEHLPGLSEDERRLRYLFDYSWRPKRTALYLVDTSQWRVRHLFDLPSAGDTAFPSLVRTGAHTFLVANYTSPLDDPDRLWVEGQTSPDGTAIYLLDLWFATE